MGLRSLGLSDPVGEVYDEHLKRNITVWLFDIKNGLRPAATALCATRRILPHSDLLPSALLSRRSGSSSARRSKDENDQWPRRPDRIAQPGGDQQAKAERAA